MGRRFTGAVFTLVALAGTMIVTSEAEAALGPVRLRPTIGPPLTSVLVEGAGYLPGETIELRFDGAPWGTITADSAGQFSTTAVVPAGAVPGRHTILAAGTASGTTGSRRWSTRSDWPQEGGASGHSGFNATENVIDASSVATLAEAWRRVIGGGSTLQRPSPVVWKGKIFVASPGSITALRATDGRHLWTSVIDAEPLTIGWSGATAAPGRVVFSTGREVVGLRIRDGAVMWRIPLVWVNPTITVHERAAFVTTPTTAHAIDLRNGRIRWERAISGTVNPPSLCSGTVANACAIAPSADTSRLYVPVFRGPELAGRLDAFDLTTGDLAWSTPLSGSIPTRAAVADGRVTVGVGALSSCNGTVNVLDAATGTSLVPPVSQFLTPLVNIAIDADAVQFFCFDDGRVRSKAFDGHTHGVAATDEKAWIGGITIANGLQYVGNELGHVRAFDLDSGSISWQVDLSATGPVWTPIVVNDGVVYVIAGSTLIAYRTS